MPPDPETNINTATSQLFKYGYEAVIEQMLPWDITAIAFLRVFGFLFVINHGVHKEQTCEPGSLPYQRLIKLFHDEVKVLMQSSDSQSPIIRIKNFGLALCDKYRMWDSSASASNRNYFHHKERYQSGEFIQDCLFHKSLCSDKHRNAVISCIAEILNYAYDSYYNDLIILNKRLRSYFRTHFPNYRLMDSLDASKATAIALYSVMLAPTHKQNKRFCREIPLDTYLPLYEELHHPRSGGIGESTEELSAYIPITETFPLITVERFQAMCRLWKETRNYYAGWELFAIYKYGAHLYSITSRRYWIIRKEEKRANDILKKLSDMRPSTSVQFLSTRDSSDEYFAGKLQKYSNLLLKPIDILSPEIREMMHTLDKMTPYSPDATIMYYRLCQAKTHKLYADYFLSFDSWYLNNEEIGDIIANSDSGIENERLNHVILFYGALSGSVECLKRYIKQYFDSPELAKLIYEMIKEMTSASQEEIPNNFRKILDCFNMFQELDWTYVDPKTLKDLRVAHKTNLLLMKNHLEACSVYSTRSSRSRIDNDVELFHKCSILQNDIDQILNAFNQYIPDDEELENEEYTLTSEPPMESSLPR